MLLTICGAQDGPAAENRAAPSVNSVGARNAARLHNSQFKEKEYSFTGFICAVRRNGNSFSMRKSITKVVFYGLKPYQWKINPAFWSLKCLSHSACESQQNGNKFLILSPGIT